MLGIYIPPKVNEARDYKLFHYYGDIVRILFLTASFLMMVTLPIFQDRIPYPILFSIFGILILGIIGGFINPRQKVVIVISILVALGAFAFFEYYAVICDCSIIDPYFLTNQVLAMIFFAALYFGIKSLRGLLVSPK